ncbi:glycosyltransferase family 2 protein [Microbulbifer sediminum]|uniref:glycosyltransferase family 2 protein n=1 Tax=Microbulbifer sediminum TaxID=2904250 RepID=UPI001F2977DC|nr:glycosyltransferase family 2 protein [Microbulbifer sediminum]
MLEFAAEYAGSRATLTLHVDCGSGADPALSVSLPLKWGRVAKRVCYFPEPVRELVLEVSIAPDGQSAPESGLPEISHCCLAWLAPHFARGRICQRLANMHHRYRGLEHREVVRALRQEAAGRGRTWHGQGLSRYAETFHKRCPDAGYQMWLAQVEAETLPCAGEVADYLAEQKSPPQFLFHLHLPAIQELDLGALHSLRQQSYPNWRLAVTIGVDVPPALVAELERISADDERITLLPDDARLGDLLEEERGDFVAALPYNDHLAQHALYYIARAVGAQPDALLVYTDSDSLNRAGEREAPLFKPGWNPDLLLAYNYIGSACLFRRPLLDGFRSLRLDSWSESGYRLLLEARARLGQEDVAHVPRVLYHQKPLLETALAACQGAEREALAGYLSRVMPGTQLEDGQLFPGSAAVMRCRFPIPEPAPLVSLLVPTRDGIEYLRRCVGSILSLTDYPNFEVLVLDNQSSCRETLAYLQQVETDARVRVLRWDYPFNYSAINNFGARHARGELLGLINNDIEVISPGWLREMVSHACRPEIGCVGAKLYYDNDTVQHGGVILGIGGTAGHSHKYARREEPGYMGRLQVVQNLSAVTGACLVLRKSVFEEVGGLNERDLPVAYNDVDLCLKVREAGYRNLWTPYAELYHHESLSRGADDTFRKRRRAQREAEYMRKRWGQALDTDPAYNPNLTLVHEDFSLK